MIVMREQHEFWPWKWWLTAPHCA